MPRWTISLRRSSETLGSQSVQPDENLMHLFSIEIAEPLESATA